MEWRATRETATYVDVALQWRGNRRYPQSTIYLHSELPQTPTLQMSPIDPSQAMLETGLALAKSAFSRERTASRTANLIRKLDLIVDSEITKAQATSAPLACKRGCDHCCHRVIHASIPEAIQVAEYIATRFTAEQKERLKGRLNAYEHEIAPRFGMDLYLARPACPLLENHECTCYEARPLGCRAANSYDVARCIKSKEHPEEQVAIPSLGAQRQIVIGMTSGLSEALKQSELDGELYDFGRALKIALDHATAAQDFFENKSTFMPAQTRGNRQKEEVVPRNVRPSYPVYGPGQEPTGNIDGSDLQLSVFLAFNKGDTIGALNALQGDHPIYKLKRITTPTAYASEEEIEPWRERFVKEIRGFAQSKFDPRQAFDAVRWVQLFSLAYQLNDVRGPLSEFGDLLCNQITAKSFPSLSTPMEVKKRPGKIKVGYISHNIRNSNGSKWAWGWMTNHSEDIETTVINLFEGEDKWSLKFKNSADHYYHLHGNVGLDARFIKNLDLDVLIYTDIGMDGRNYQFASMRLAPIQCTAWGHPVTSGMHTIDYYLSSDLMEPADADDHYRERLIRLPNSGLCYHRTTTPVSTLSKADFGLDDGPLMLMCQNIMKCHPKWDYLYRRINEETGRPILFLQWQMQGVTRIVKERFEKAGINAIWLPPIGGYDFLRLVELAEVSLDPPGWSGGNSTLQALDLHVPVVTLPGEFMRGRHSLAFLQIAGAEDLVAKDGEDYIKLAVDKTRRDKAMVNLNPDALFEDKKPVIALDEFLRSVTGR